MVQLIRPFQLVELSCPYDTWDNPTAPALFTEMVSLKLAGYLSRHRYGTLPLDTTDFIADHLLLCEDKGGALIPVSGFKSVTAQRCKIHNLPFPGLAILNSSKAPIHAESLQAILNRCENTERPIAYVSSFTVAPRMQESAPLCEMAKDIMVSALVNYHRAARIPELIACGAPKVHTDQFVASIGFRPLRAPGSDQGAEPLPAFQQTSLMGADAIMMHLNAYSERANQLSELYRDLWERRLIIVKPVARAAEAA